MLYLASVPHRYQDMAPQKQPESLLLNIEKIVSLKGHLQPNLFFPNHFISLKVPIMTCMLQFRLQASHCSWHREG